LTEKELKKMLWEYPKIQAKLNELLAEIASINARADTLRGIKSPVIDGLPHGSGMSDNTFKAAQMIVDEYDAEMSGLLSIYNETLKQEKETKDLLKRLTRTETEIIKLFYFEGRQWFYIANIVHWSDRQCRRARDSAISVMLK